MLLLVILKCLLLLYIVVLFTLRAWKCRENDFQDSIWKVLHTLKLHSSMQDCCVCWKESGILHYMLCCFVFFSGTMNDIKGMWSSLGEDKKQKYFQEAAALRAQGQAENHSPKMRELKIKKHLKHLKWEV